MSFLPSFRLLLLLGAWSAYGVAAQEVEPLGVPRLAEPEFPAESRHELVAAVGGARSFVLPHLDTRMKVPPNQSFVWSGSSVNGETSIGAFTLRLKPENEGVDSSGVPIELEFVVEPEALRIRAANPVLPEQRGGFRFARAANFVRRIAARLEGRRELAVLAPAMSADSQGFGVVFCLTAIESREIAAGGGTVKTIDYPSRQPFVIDSALFVPRGFIEGRIRSGILPAEARATIAHTANIGAVTEEIDETISQDPSVGVTYAPRGTPQFVAVERPDRVGAIVRAEVELSTPAGHRQKQTIASEVWIERLAEVFATSAGGLEMMPKELLAPDAPPEGPIYGSCFAVGGRHIRSSSYAEPKVESGTDDKPA